MHPMGLVLLQGFGGYRNYYKDALDRLGVTVNLVRVGSFKSAGEAFDARSRSSRWRPKIRTANTTVATGGGIGAPAYF